MTAVEGCMDEFASNYNPDANIPTECLYICDDVATTIEITGGSWNGELYWELVNNESGIAEYLEDLTQQVTVKFLSQYQHV